MAISIAAQAQITVDLSMPLTACEGTALSVDYTAVGTFNAGNVFTLELSDALGSFAAPMIIGSLASTTSGTIACTIPVATPAGSGYRLRVNADDPITVGAPSLYPVSVMSAPDPGVSTTLPWCLSDGPFNMFAQLGGTPEPGGYWTSPGGSPYPNVFTPGVDLSGVYTYTVMGVPPCPNAASALTVIVNTLCMTGTPVPLLPTY